jgi:hypothetical protein
MAQRWSSPIRVLVAPSCRSKRKRAGSNDKERAQAVVNTAVGLAEHTEKERLTNPGSARSCCCYFLSTSNYSLDELGEKGDIEIDDAERGRLVDVVLPVNGHGLYEDLHGFADGGKLTDELKARSCRFFGTPRHEFAKRLAKQRTEDKSWLKRWLERRRQRYLNKLKKEVKKLQSENPAAKTPLQRASARYATVYAAGTLGTTAGSNFAVPNRKHAGACRYQKASIPKPKGQANRLLAAARR